MPNPYEEKLREFVDDEILFNAVKGILLAQCDLNNLKREEGTTAQILGETAGAWLVARELIHQGFKDIEKYKKTSHSDGNNKNPNGV